MKDRAFRLLSAGLLGLSCARVGMAQDLIVYDDVFKNGFTNASWDTTVDPNVASPVHGGTKSISIQHGAAWGAFRASGTWNVAAYDAISFWVRGGNANVVVAVDNGAPIWPSVSLATYIVGGGGISSSVWKRVLVPLADLGFAAGTLDGIAIQDGNGSGAAQPLYYIDDLTLVAAGAPPPASLVQIEHDVLLAGDNAGFLSDRFTWRDAANQPRVAVLTHNNPEQPQGPTAAGGYPNRGGALRQFQYQLPGGATRTAGVTNYGNGGYGGFGYVVSHAAQPPSTCVGDDSPLGYGTPGQWQRVFEGRHHVIFRFTQNYPRNCSTSAPAARTVPVTIDWVVSTGRDNLLWAITFDLSGHPVDRFYDDSRAPYGELNIDGTGADDIDGVAWGDRFKFTSTAAPVSLSSSWTWNVANTIPYVKLWIAGPLTGAANQRDATMGIVQTQTIDQQDAGAGRNPWYHDLTPYWNTVSAGNPFDGYAMPWQDSWPYQANSFSIGVGAPNNNARLTWGTQYGFLGQSAYDRHDPNANMAPGWPKKSYSTYVVLGTHSSGPVEAQVAQVEAVQTLALTAATGAVVTSGPAGVNRADSVTYAPAGWNHVYGALAFNASGNELDANVAVGAGKTLAHPLFIVGSYTAGLPATVKLGGATLVQDADYYPSVRAGANELWLTLNRDLTGATNRLEILNGAAPPAPTINASGPTTFCAGGSVTLTASLPPGAGVSYLWSPGNQTTQAIVVTASGSYSVTVTVDGTPGTSAPTVVTVNPIPATPVITAPANAAVGQTGLVASVVAHGGSAYSWGITNGTIASGAGTNQITFTAGAAGSLGLTVIETNAGCASAQAGATVAVGAALSVAVDPSLDRKAVSPDIYGVNLATAAQVASMGYPVNRWGGNPVTRYNWQVNADNRAIDWFFLNQGYAGGAGAEADAFIDGTRAGGAQTFLSVPMLGRVAKDASSYSFPTSLYAGQTDNEGNHGGNPDRGNGCLLDNAWGGCATHVTGNDPNRTSVAHDQALVTSWMAHISTHLGGKTAANGGQKYYGLDNEPGLWHETHHDVWKPMTPPYTSYAPLGAVEHWNRTETWAAAMKAQDPAAKIFGPSDWLWCTVFFTAAENCTRNGGGYYPDWANHGSKPFLRWYLQKAKEHETATGVRILDYADTHYYPQATGVFDGVEDAATSALRLRSLKSLYDPTYTDESWLADQGEPGLAQQAAIPTLKSWIAAEYPGTKLAIGEYAWGGGTYQGGFDGPSCALAQAEALAIFAREGVDMALRWTAPDTNTLIEDAFKLYLNYDGAGHKVAGETCRATSTNVDAVGAYAQRSASPAGPLYVLLFNKDTVSRSVPVTVAGLGAATANLYRFSQAAGAAGRLQSAGTASFSGGAVTLSLPARSATLVVVPLPGTPGSKFYPVTPCRLLDTRNPNGTFGGPAMGAGTSRTWTASAGACGIPADAKALSANVTVTQPTAAGELRIYPANVASPVSSANSFRTNGTRANNTMVGLSPAGAFTVDALLPSGSAHVILDVNGYFK